jgi:hypothetical protein
MSAVRPRQHPPFIYVVNWFGVVVQLVRIPACHAGGRGFESRPLRQQKFYLCILKGHSSGLFYFSLGCLLTTNGLVWTCSGLFVQVDSKEFPACMCGNLLRAKMQNRSDGLAFLAGLGVRYRQRVVRGEREFAFLFFPATRRLVVSSN